MTKKPPELKADDIVSVQPMVKPSNRKLFEYRKPTAEEIMAFDRFDKATKVINDFFRSKKGDKYSNELYEIKCPNCDGTIKFCGNSYNGHVHAACSTDGCFSMME